MRDIVAALNIIPSKSVPIILFTKNVGENLVALSETGCTAVSVDWTLSLDKARALVGHKVALQGNLDPAVLYADAAYIQSAVQTVLRQFGEGNGHIFNLGHGIHPDVAPEKVAIMIEAVHAFSTRHHPAYEGGYA
jgi:uroporphyrinogen decarboxylase